MNKSVSSPSLLRVQTPEWLLEAAQQIQVMDYELHAAIRIMSRGQMLHEHIPGFFEACAARDRLMAQVLSHLASLKVEAENAERAVTDLKH